MKNEAKLIFLSLLLIITTLVYTIAINAELENSKEDIAKAGYDLAITTYKLGWVDGFSNAANLRKGVVYTKDSLDNSFKADSLRFIKTLYENGK